MSTSKQKTKFEKKPQKFVNTSYHVLLDYNSLLIIMTSGTGKHILNWIQRDGPISRRNITFLIVFTVIALLQYDNVTIKSRSTAFIKQSFYWIKIKFSTGRSNLSLLPPDQFSVFVINLRLTGSVISLEITRSMSRSNSTFGGHFVKPLDCPRTQWNSVTL